MSDLPYEYVYDLLVLALDKLKDSKPNDRSELDRHFAIAITDMEKVRAYFNTYVVAKDNWRTVKKDLLLEIKAALLEAIYHEDGLDGGDATYLVAGINRVLGVPADDHTPPEGEAD